MITLVRHNRLYFILLGFFMLLGGIYTLFSGKADAIWFFSENRTHLGDSFFRFITHFGEEKAYILVAVVFMMIRMRYAILVGLTGFVVMGVSSATKVFFAQDRPLAFLRKQHLDSLLNVVQGVDLHTGATSFPSGHSMAAFALYSLLIFLLPKRKRFIASLFTLAFLVGLSRIYLIQHFWVDVYTGAIIGVFLAMLVYALNDRFRHKFMETLDNPLIPIGRKKEERTA